MPDYDLVVRQAFGDYQRGDVVADADVEKVMADGREHTHVVKRAKVAAPTAGQEH
jgi:hypothetical protein